MLNQLRERIGTFWLWIGFLGLVILVGLYAVFLIFTKGLVVTNMSDGAPWGLWIILDLSCNNNTIIHICCRRIPVHCKYFGKHCGKL